MRTTFVGLVLTATLAALLFLISPSAPAGPAPANDESLATQVREAIRKGKAWLRRQAGDGTWAVDKIGGKEFPTAGTVSLALLAMITCGGTDDDKATVEAGLKFLRANKPKPNDLSATYVVSLQTMVYALNGDPQDLDAIKSNAQWLLGARLGNGYWSYFYRRGGPGDASNTQYAVLALHESFRAGASIGRRDLQSIQDFYLDKQTKKGAWGYDDKNPVAMTMTTAGLCSLAATGMDLNEGHDKLNDDGSDPNCGKYTESAAVEETLKYIGDGFPANPRDMVEAGAHLTDLGLRVPFYGFYGIERAGRLTGRRFIGGHYWYRVGCRCLVNSQHEDGSWGDDKFELDGMPIVATSFALLFLAEGRTPVLMTKLAYGQNDDGWNNKHNDLRNVVEYASKELFKKQPMAWQIFDIRDLEAGNDAAIHDLTEQLLESPIVFFSGHDKAPDPDGIDAALLKSYLDKGGFLLVETCCGAKNHPDFDKSFRKLAKTMYPDADLKPLKADHPLYTASGRASDPTDFPLDGIEKNGKTIVVYSPHAISGYWEADDRGSDKGKKAFALADNVIAYATGLKPPQARLDKPAP